MRKVQFITLCMLIAYSTNINSQVTIGSGKEPEKYSILEIDSNEGGLRLPQLNDEERIALQEKFSASKEKSKGIVIYNTTAKEVQYWDGSQWVSSKSDGSGSSNHWLISGSTEGATSNTQDIYQMGSVAIGHDGEADPAAILNVQSDNKGILLPRVTLKGPADIETIPNPTTGLLVYNTGKHTDFATTGYMFWDGSQWKLFTHATSEAASGTLNCSGAQMSPGQQVVSGTPIITGTVLQIPYTGGNGGTFNGITLTSIGNPDVKATIGGGMLSVGNGVLTFSLSGIPNLFQQPPYGIIFDVTPFLEANPGISGCRNIIVGNALTALTETSAVMGYLMYGNDNTGNDASSGYSLQCTSPDGKFSARVFVPSSVTSISRNNQNINIQVRNNQNTAQTVIWNYSTVYSGGQVQTANMFTMPAQVWGGTTGASTTWTNAGEGGYWGDKGIYDGSGPEYRRYTWIPLGPNNKVAYEICVMCALDTDKPTEAVSPTLLKVYIKFVQTAGM